MSDWYFSQNFNNGDANPNSYVARIGFVPGEQVVMHVTALVTTPAAAAATATVTLSVGDGFGTYVSASEVLDLTLMPNTIVFSLPLPFPVPLGSTNSPVSTMGVSLSIVWTGTAGDGQTLMSVTKS